MSEILLIIEVLTDKVADFSTKVLNSEDVAACCIFLIGVVIGFMLAATLVL